MKFDDDTLTGPKKESNLFTSVSTVAELDGPMEGAKTEQLLLAINIPQGSKKTTGDGKRKLSDREVCLARSQRSAEIKSTTCGDQSQQTNLEASKQPTAHSNIEGLDLPKQKQINDKKFLETVESTSEEIYKDIEKELRIKRPKREKPYAEEWDKHVQIKFASSWSRKSSLRLLTEECKWMIRKVRTKTSKRNPMAGSKPWRRSPNM